MGDVRPPKLVGDERSTLLALYAYQRDSLVRKLDQVSEEDARRALVPSGTSLLWLVKHCTGAEARWFLDRFAASAPPPEADALTDSDTIASVVAAYESMWSRITGIVAEHGLDEPARRMPDGEDSVNLRWILMHLLEETARHAGHADILREQVDGATGR